MAGLTMTGRPDEVAPIVPIDLPGIVSARYRAYPLVDHIADKVCALIEVHPRAGRPDQPSTRYRDLADLAVIARTQSVGAVELGRALASEASRRRIELPAAFAAPDGTGWRSGYARVARDVPGLTERDLDAAVATVKRFLDPVLARATTGIWNSERQRWA